MVNFLGRRKSDSSNTASVQFIAFARDDDLWISHDELLCVSAACAAARVQKCQLSRNLIARPLSSHVKLCLCVCDDACLGN